MSRRDRGVELAAVRMTEEFIVFGKVNHVGVDAYIDPSVQKRKRRNRRGEHCSPVPTPSPQLLRPSGTSSMRGGARRAEESVGVGERKNKQKYFLFCTLGSM